MVVVMHDHQDVCASREIYYFVTVVRPQSHRPGNQLATSVSHS